MVCKLPCKVQNQNKIGSKRKYTSWVFTKPGRLVNIKWYLWTMFWWDFKCNHFGSVFRNQITINFSHPPHPNWSYCAPIRDNYHAFNLPLKNCKQYFLIYQNPCLFKIDTLSGLGLSLRGKRLMLFSVAWSIL